jgi:hypothetical protein
MFIDWRASLYPTGILFGYEPMRYQPAEWRTPRSGVPCTPHECPSYDANYHVGIMTTMAQVSTANLHFTYSLPTPEWKHFFRRQAGEEPFARISHGYQWL